MGLKLKTKIFIFGIIIILILTSIPQNTIATDVDNEIKEPYLEATNKDNEKGEWKTNSFCRVRADGLGYYIVKKFNGGGAHNNDIWFGIAKKISAYVSFPGSLKISGREGSDYVRADEIEIRGDFFIGICIARHVGEWYMRINLVGFVLNCRYKVTD